jgi:hypothetical protein
MIASYGVIWLGLSLKGPCLDNFLWRLFLPIKEIEIFHVLALLFSSFKISSDLSHHMALAGKISR